MPVAAGLYYFAHGADDLTRPPVILIHGAGGHHLSWPAQVRRLPNERILAVDLPGHGKSAGVGHHTIQDYADEIQSFIQALKLPAAVLVGHSMGGAVALQVAMDAPGRVLGLGLIGSGSRLRVNPALLQRLSDPSKMADAVHAVIEYSFAPGTGERLKDLVEQRMLDARTSVLYGDFRACDQFSPAGTQIAQIAVPTLILSGEQDKMVSPQAGRALQTQIRGARFEPVPGAGHMVMLEQPDRVAELLGSFLPSIPYQPGQSSAAQG